jgi:hypothetical protein
MMRMTARSLFASSLLVAGALFLARSTAPGAPAQPPEETKSVQIIKVTAKKYEFNRSPIRVKQATKVQLKITATDHAHGFKIKPFPEGSIPDGQSRSCVLVSPRLSENRETSNCDYRVCGSNLRHILFQVPHRLWLASPRNERRANRRAVTGM